MPGDTVIGLSKLNRIVEYYSRRPQLQEQLTQQIHAHVNKVMPDNKGVAVFVEARHLCVELRGVNQQSEMNTVELSGAFLDNPQTRAEFYSLVNTK